MIEFLNSGKKKNILYFAKFPDVYFTIQVLFERFATNKLWTKLHGVRRYFDYEVFKQMLEFEHVLRFHKMQNKDLGSIFINIDSFHWQSALWQSILNGS